MTPRAVADARRASGLLLALVLVVSQASAWFHAAAIAHVACLEHGEAMHRPAAPAGAPAAESQQPAPPDGVRQVALRADLATAGGHDHCANAALLRWRDVALTAPTALAAFVPAPRALAFAPARDGSHGAAVYRLAPKTSPPRAGA
jgi:hypothetical protein